MKRGEVVALLVGRTIAAVDVGSYLLWPLTIQSITFTDGWRVELAGNADEARIWSVTDPSGQSHDVEGEGEEEA